MAQVTLSQGLGLSRAQKEQACVCFIRVSCLHITASALWLEKTLEIYKTIKYKDEIFFHPTVRVSLPGSKAAVIFQFLHRQIFKMTFFSKAP